MKRSLARRCPVRELHGKVSTSKYANIVFKPGDRVLLVMPGGGYGDPARRDPARIREDLAEGYISEAAARDAYGFAEG